MDSSGFRKMMIATDGSELVKKAVDKAIELAKLTGAKLYALYAVAYGGALATLPMDGGGHKQ